MNYCYMFFCLFWSVVIWITNKNMDRRAEEYNRKKGFMMYNDNGEKIMVMPVGVE